MNARIAEARIILGIKIYSQSLKKVGFDAWHDAKPNDIFTLKQRELVK
ncbi:hypothetical protein D1BOALGB6SA_5647 [Olavius sp. associated proteobacterium Delta 1]|nr:hypothetical protein D1BOALGB6SA_5647 [Olavius sp. associated proteobacterium Delta 1]